MGSRSEFQDRIAFTTTGFSGVVYPALRIGTAILAGLIFFLITLGGLVRNAGAGLSCPDWPLCFGRVVPPMSIQVFLEWFHRLIAGSVSAIFLTVFGVVFLRSELRERYGRNCGAALLLLMAQVVLGGLTVLGLLSPKWVSSHLAVGMAFFGTILWLALSIRDHHRLANETAELPRWFGRLAIGAAAVLYLQIIMGGLVSSNYAGLVCPDFPTCNGSWFPPFEGLVRFQFLHRVGATLATLAILALCASALGKPLSRRARLALFALPVLLGVQVLLGVGSVLFKLPLPMSVAHLGTAAALFGMLLVMVYEIRLAGR